MHGDDFCIGTMGYPEGSRDGTTEEEVTKGHLLGLHVRVKWVKSADMLHL